MSGSFNKAMLTPLKKVRGLGSAREGTMHFWRQRLTAVALVPLTLFFVGLIISLYGADFETVRAALGNPFTAIVLGLMVVTGLVHMRLGMQVVIEDYVHGEAAKLVALILNMFFTFAIGAVAVFALIKLALGG